MGTASERFQDAGYTMTEVDLATDADVVVCATGCVLGGIYVNVVASAHAINILDGATTVLILPASVAAGTQINTHGVIINKSLSVNSNDSATGKIVIFWKIA